MAKLKNLKHQKSPLTHEIAPFHHTLTKVYRFAINAESAIALMMDQAFLVTLRIYPDTLDFQHKQVMAPCPTGIDDATFQIGPTFPNQGDLDRFRGHRCQAKSLELIDLRA